MKIINPLAVPSTSLTNIDINRKYNVIVNVYLFFHHMNRQKTKDHECKQKYISNARGVSREKTIKKSVKNIDKASNS